LVAVDGRELPPRGTRVVADACAGRARVKLEQRFVNAFAELLSVTYTLPLPADGAVAGFSFMLDGERTMGRIEKRSDAC
jgi:Ca-activated chloride channel family protein